MKRLTIQKNGTRTVLNFDSTQAVQEHINNPDALPVINRVEKDARMHGDASESFTVESASYIYTVVDVHPDTPYS